MESAFSGIMGKSDKEKQAEKAAEDSARLAAQLQRGRAAQGARAATQGAAGPITISRVVFPITLNIDGHELTPVIKEAVDIILKPTSPIDKEL